MSDPNCRKAISEARREILSNLERGGILRTGHDFSYPAWDNDVRGLGPPPRQQAAKGAHDAGHLKLVREETVDVYGRCSFWTISEEGGAALAESRKQPT